MAVELSINGLFKMTFFYMNGKQVGQHKDKDIELGILDDLEMGEYVISLDKKEVYNINDLETPIYTFVLDPTDNVEYDFDEL